MEISFFIPMVPPTVTHQQKKVHVVNGKPVHYEPAKLAGAVRLVVKWCFPAKDKHTDGAWKVTRPDTDNLQKLLKDCMTDVGFWNDDAQVCSEVIEKFWASIPGIYIFASELEGPDES